MAAQTVLDRFVVQYLFEGDEQSLERIEQRVAKVKRGLDSASRKLTLAGTALSGALFKVGKTVFNFQVELNGLRAATNASDEAMARMEAKAKELGESTQFSASQAAAAMRILGQAGLKEEQILGAVPRVLKLAAAGSLDMAQAADIATSIMAGFGFEVDKLQRVNDILATAATSAKVEVHEMGTAISRAAPIASNLGVSLEDVAAGVAAIQNKGFSAEEAGTGFRNVLQRLLKIAGPGEDAFNKLGLSIEETQSLLKQGRITDVLNNLRNAGIESEHAIDIFGLRTASIAFALIDSKEKVDEIADAFDKADGASDRMADQRMEGIVGAIKRLVSQLEALDLALGEAGVTKSIIWMSEKVIELIEGFRSLSPLVKSLVAHTIVGGPFLIAFGAALQFVKFALSPLVAIMKLLIPLLWRGAAAVIGISWPVLLIAAGIALLIAIIVGLIFYWDEVKAAFAAGWDWLAERVSAAVDKFVLYWEGMKAKLRGLLLDLRYWIDNLFSGIWNWTTEVVAGAFDWIKGAYASAISFIDSLTSGVWDWTTNAIADAFSWISDAFNNVTGFIKDNWREILSTFFTPHIAIFNWIREAFSNAVSGLTDLIPGPVKRLLGIENETPADGRGVTSSLAEGISRTGKDVINVWDKLMGEVQDRTPSSDAKKGPLSNLTASGRALVTTFASGIAAASPALGQTLQNSLAHPLVLPGLTSPLPIGPSPHAFDRYSGDGNNAEKVINVTIGEIRIDAPGANAEEVAQNISASLRDQLDVLIYENDSLVSR